ncbi:uncharacterized protein RJT21DRAFT_1730 [Scheffersomyces amazonensis]|uniref:uncharacterized protein n=1 Tax=Scheffersomyces amazonensis TaxID=1078765 RepID=UPI00315D491C
MNKNIRASNKIIKNSNPNIRNSSTIPNNNLPHSTPPPQPTTTCSIAESQTQSQTQSQNYINQQHYHPILSHSIASISSPPPPASSSSTGLDNQLSVTDSNAAMSSNQNSGANQASVSLGSTLSSNSSSPSHSTVITNTGSVGTTASTSMGSRSGSLSGPRSSSITVSNSTSKRSNFQFTYDADNFLLDLIFRYKHEIFTRGNTIKTWELVLSEFNRRFHSNIIQSRTINNRFKALRKNLENKLINEPVPLSELNLNENEKLLVSLNEFLNIKEMLKQKATENKFLDTSTITNANPPPGLPPVESSSNVNTSFINSQDPMDIDATATSTTTSPSFIQLSPSLHAQQQLAHQQQQHLHQRLLIGNSYSNPTNPNTSTIQPVSPNTANLAMSNALSQTQEHSHAQAQQFQFQFPPNPPVKVEQVSYDNPMLHHTSLGSVSQLQQQQQQQQQQQLQKPQQLHSPVQIHPPIPTSQQQQHQPEDSPLHKRLKTVAVAAPPNELINQLVVSQNEYISQVKDLRKELQEFRYEVDYKIKDIFNKIDTANDTLHLKINNCFEYLMAKKEGLATNDAAVTHYHQEQQEGQQHHHQHATGLQSDILSAHSQTSSNIQANPSHSIDSSVRSSAHSQQQHQTSLQHQQQQQLHQQQHQQSPSQQSQQQQQHQ